MAAGSDRARQRAEVRRQEIAERQRREARRRLLFRIAVPVVAVIVVVGVFVGIKVAGGGSGTGSGVVATGAAPASLVQEITTVSASAFDTAGVDADVKGPEPLSGAAALTADGKPRVLYVGGEFCPYCAAERWVVVTALARFGTWSDLALTNSASGDVYPDTATLSFHGASYTSDYLAFTGYETTDRDHQPLDTLAGDDLALFQQYNPGGSIPFQDLGGKFTVSGAEYSPQLLADKTHAEVAAAVADPSTDIGRAVLAAANLYTAALCELTGGQPGDVCTSSGVTAAAAQLGS